MDRFQYSGLLPASLCHQNRALRRAHNKAWIRPQGRKVESAARPSGRVRCLIPLLARRPACLTQQASRQDIDLEDVLQ